MGDYSRRDFIGSFFVAGVIASGIKLEAKEIEHAQESIELSGNEFYLSIKEAIVNFTGSPKVAQTINGMYPGPTLRWKEGDEITIHVKNELKEDTSLHWHGIMLPANMDGVPDVNFRAIKPNETFTYKFKAKQNGTYWYHSHSGYQEQTGVFGALVIDPKKNDPYESDKEYVLFLSDWSDEKPSSIHHKLKTQAGYYNFSKRTIGDFIYESKEKGFLRAFSDRKMWNKMTMSDRDISDVTGYTYTFLMNGAKKPYFEAKKGEKIRLRIINGSSMTFFDFRIPDKKMRVISADGNLIHSVVVDEIRIGVAETYDVIVDMEDDYSYSLFAQAIDRSGYVCGVLGIDNSSNYLPTMDSLPVLSHADMGMMGYTPNSSTDEHSGHKMPTMDHSKMNHDEHSGHDMSNHDIKMSEDNITIGPSVEMISPNPQYRLNDPGVGLRDNGRKVLVYNDLKSLVDYSKPVDRGIIIHLTGNMERYIWGIDGISYKDAKPWKWKFGERVRITCINDTMMNHPMHMHGLWSDLEDESGNFLARKHTIVVQPGAKISFCITADALGSWVFHCHLLYHMMEMFRRVDVEETI